MRIITLLALLAVSSLFVGCKSNRINEGTAPPQRIPTVDTQVRFNNVGITDDSIADKIAVEATNWQPNTSGTARVWAQLRNRTDFQLAVEARTQFFDRSGAPLDRPSAWQRIYLSPNTITTYRENSVDPATTYYYIEVREAR